MRAFAYYAYSTTRNRAQEQLQKLAKPDNLAGAVLGLVLMVGVGGGLYQAAREFRIDLQIALTIFVGLQIAAVWIGMPMQLGTWRQQLGLGYREAEIECL